MSPRRKNVAVPRRNTPHWTAVCGVISPANEPFSGQKTGYCNRWDSLFACFPAKWGPNFGWSFYEAAPLNGNETALPPPELALWKYQAVETPSQFLYWNTRHMSPSITHHITHIHHQCPRPPLWAYSWSATHHIAFVTRCSFTGLACQLPTWVHFLSFPIMSAVHLWLLMGAHIFHDALAHNMPFAKKATHIYKTMD